MPDRPLPQDFRVQIPEQLPLLLQGFRKAAGLTQAETARRLGVTQQTFSSLERNAHRMSAERLMALLSLLGVSLVLRQDRIGGARGASEASGMGENICTNNYLTKPEPSRHEDLTKKVRMGQYTRRTKSP